MQDDKDNRQRVKKQAKILQHFNSENEDLLPTTTTTATDDDAKMAEKK